jgi:hypothetical protein
MAASVRQHKAPYFYTRRGSNLVLMEHGVPTKQTFSSEAAAKRTVLELNDAWRAKGVKKSNLRRRNPPRSGLGIPRDLVLPKDLTPYGITASALQTYRDKMAAMLQDIMPSLPPESVLGGPAAPGRYSVVGEWVAAPAMKPSKAISLGFQIALPQAGPRAYVFINTLITAAEPSIHGRRAVPPMWGISAGPSFVDAPEVQAQFRRLPQKDFIRRGYNYVEALRDIDAIKAYLLAALGVQRRNPRRRNPARKFKEGRDPSGMYKLSDLKKGEFFKRKPTARKVYTKGDYDRGSKKYGCGDYEAVGDEIFLTGDTMVYVGFDY